MLLSRSAGLPAMMPGQEHGRLTDEPHTVGDRDRGTGTSGSSVTEFGRTGTLSLREALVQLRSMGLCDHMRENFEHPERYSRSKRDDAFRSSRPPVSRSIWRSLSGMAFRRSSTGRARTSRRELTAAHPLMPKSSSPSGIQSASTTASRATIFSHAGRPITAGGPGHHFHLHLRGSTHRSRALPKPFLPSTIRRCKRRWPRPAAGLRRQAGLAATLCVSGRPRSGR